MRRAYRHAEECAVCRVGIDFNGLVVACMYDIVSRLGLQLQFLPLVEAGSGSGVCCGVISTRKYLNSGAAASALGTCCRDVDAS